MIHAGEGGTIIRVDHVRLVPSGDPIPQLLDEAGEVGLAGPSGQEPVLGR